MKSMGLRRAEAFAEAIDHDLRADDPRFNRDVLISLEGGGMKHYCNAFLLVWKDPDETEWFLVFPEHDDVWCVEVSDVSFIRQYAFVDFERAL